MIALKLRQESRDTTVGEVIGILVHLIDVAIGVERGCRDGERYEQLDVVTLDEIAQSAYLSRIEGTDDEVAGCYGRILEHFADIAILGRVPRMDVDGESAFLQTVAGHQHAAVVFHHASAVAIVVVQRQHDTQSQGLGADGR